MENLIQIKDQETGRIITLSNEDYELIAMHVRNQDKKNYAVEVLCNGLTCQDSRLSNVESYIIFNEKLLEAFADSLSSSLSCNTGEKEYAEVDNWKENHEVAFYRVLSNKGTEYEQTNTVIMSKEQADAILSKQWTGTLETVDGDIVDTKYISEIDFISRYED